MSRQTLYSYDLSGNIVKKTLATGTFITRDPLGFKAGLNMYTYVRQNPWTKFDPEGLDDNSNQNNQTPKTNPQPKSPTAPQASFTTKPNSQGDTTYAGSVSAGVGSKNANVIVQVGGGATVPVPAANPAVKNPDSNPSPVSPTNTPAANPGAFIPNEQPPTVNVQASVTGNVQVAPSLKFQVQLRGQDQTNSPPAKPPPGEKPKPPPPQAGPPSVIGEAGIAWQPSDKLKFTATVDDKFKPTGKGDIIFTGGAEYQFSKDAKANLQGSYDTGTKESKVELSVTPFTF